MTALELILIGLHEKRHSLDAAQFHRLDMERRRGIDDPIQLLQRIGLPASEWPRLESSAKETLQTCFFKQVNIYTYFHPSYPAPYRQLEHPPLVLYVDGILGSSKFLSVVGSRHPSQEAIQWVEQELSLVIKKSKVVTVSGGARGVDQLAHKMSVRHSLPTLIFLPSGLLHPYSADLRELAELAIRAGGAVISPFPLRGTVLKGNFFWRNRLIASLSPLLLVVEAAKRSGSVMTARLALEYGTEIAVVPHSPMVSGARGGLGLLFEGAQMVRDHADLLTLMARGNSLPNFFQTVDGEATEEDVGEPQG